MLYSTGDIKCDTEWVHDAWDKATSCSSLLSVTEFPLPLQLSTMTTTNRKLVCFSSFLLLLLLLFVAPASAVDECEVGEDGSCVPIGTVDGCVDKNEKCEEWADSGK